MYTLFSTQSFIEHLNFYDLPRAITEIWGVLISNGQRSQYTSIVEKTARKQYI